MKKQRTRVELEKRFAVHGFKPLVRLPTKVGPAWTFVIQDEDTARKYRELNMNWLLDNNIGRSLIEIYAAGLDHIQTLKDLENFLAFVEKNKPLVTLVAAAERKNR